MVNTIPAAQAALAAAVQAALDALPNLKVLDPTVAQIKVTPGLAAKSADSVTQQALTVSVTIAGQKIVDAVVGEAKASVGRRRLLGAGRRSRHARRGRAAVQHAPPGPRRRAASASAACRIFGVADPALAGRRVSIVFGATGRTVAHAKVTKAGNYATWAPLPSRRLRFTNRARYMAKLGSDRSKNLKLHRRLVVRSLKSSGGKVTITGRVLPPLGKPRQVIELRQRVSCDDDKVVKRFRPRADGRFKRVGQVAARASAPPSTG